MSDSMIRELERGCEEQPNDAIARERLERERVRSGLGWHGERLPEADCGCPIRPTDERGVYALSLHPARAPSPIVVELVYAPGGEIAFSRPPASRTIAPFYVGRFPITWEQWLAFCGATQHHARYEGAPAVPFKVGGVVVHNWANPLEHVKARSPEMLHHPATEVSLRDARTFCSWAGVRLPTAAEWCWAALGAPVKCTNCSDSEGPLGHGCVECSRAGARFRSWPWSNATDVRRENGPKARIHHPGLTPASTAPVLVSERVRRDARWVGSILVAEDEVKLLPARPQSASWCGALDMAGHVREWLQDGDRLGCSFRQPLLAGLWPREVDHGGEELGGQPQDDVGFRVVLSGAP